MSRECAPPPVGRGGSGGGKVGARVGNSGVTRRFLDEHEWVPTSKMGMTTGSERLKTTGRELASKVDWDGVSVTTLPKGARLHATEDAVKTKYIRRVLDGEPLREGYEPQLVRIGKNDFMVYDGHHRMAMHSALGNRNENLKVRIADIPELMEEQ